MVVTCPTTCGRLGGVVISRRVSTSQMRTPSHPVLWSVYAIDIHLIPTSTRKKSSIGREVQSVDTFRMALQSACKPVSAVLRAFTVEYGQGGSHVVMALVFSRTRFYSHRTIEHPSF